jgi:methylmalonyl-CoA mutase
MSESLFKDFSSVTSKQWKQKIQFDLKGADYNKTLLTHTNDGITINPFYHQDDIEKLNIPNTDKDFKICQSIFISDEQTANFLATDSLKRGADSILFIANEPFDIKTLSNKINSNEIEIHFELNFLSESFVKELTQGFKECELYINVDIIGNLVKSGNWFYNLQKDHEILGQILKNSTNNTSLIQVNVSNYQNAGATTIQEVAYALAHANEYLNHFEKNIPEQIQFNFSVGTNYFFEIAKLRAFRYLWKLLTDDYHPKTKAHIFTKPTLRNKTLYDYNTNMLRTTTECMSAILGGADTVSNISYDSVYHKKNEFGERISRNQLLILKEESYFINASEYAEGSYYIESLTKEIAQKALAIFKDIEKGGGFLKQLKEGTIQRKIKESADKEQAQFDNGELVLIGTNKHPNIDDKMNDTIELYPFVKIKPRKTLIPPVTARRLAEKMEQERLNDEA